MIFLIEILAEILQSIGSLVTRSRSDIDDIDRIERQIKQRDQRKRGRA